MPREPALPNNVWLIGDRAYEAGFEPRKLDSRAISMRLLARKYDPVTTQIHCNVSKFLERAV